ncbi:MAG: hypothetical protein AAFQ43_13340, partial [Bacteroidota bacterium]
LAYDGDAVIEMETDGGEAVTVRVPARMNLCDARGLDLVDDLVPGHRIRVVGERDPDGAIRPCVDASHEIARSGATPAQAWDGYYVGGFETSSFRACGESGDAWWLTPNDAFVERYNEIRQAHTAPSGGRQFGPHVRVQFEGIRSEPGSHGHLGASPYEIMVTELVEMTFVASGDGEWPEVDC